MSLGVARAAIKLVADKTTMIRIAPFRGVFYNQKKIRDLAKVIAPPYDVISKEEQEKLYKKSPYNFVRLDLSQEPDSYDAVARTLNEWQAQGIFERDETPAIYFSVAALQTQKRRAKTPPRLFCPRRAARSCQRRYPAARKNPRRAEGRSA